MHSRGTVNNSLRPNRIDPRVAVVLQTIDARIGDPDLTPEELAASVQLSHSRLRQLMRAHFEHGVKRHIHDRRMSRARDLLRSSFLLVREIMLLVGITDASHFCKDYKKQFGISPSEERSNHISKED